LLEKKVLEEKVQQRTAEVVKQKEELEEQKHVIEEKNKDITDSINYAEKIQRAILPDPQKIKRALPESFIFFQPRDIVSGDFFWYAEVGVANSNLLLLAAADCTGHGVPGAFMSMINTSLLNESVNEKKIYQPSEILNEVRRGIIHALKQKGEAGEQKDGMDVGLVSLEMTQDGCKVQYAAANNPLYLIRKDNPIEIEKIDADAMPVAISDRTEDFSNRELSLKKGDTFYIFTDGYADQFGGPSGKKFMYRKLKELLTSISLRDLNTQRNEVIKAFNDWKGPEEQVDDVCLMGFRYS
jgi:serine phosphatase RsbU (regulator of sigma subunit)